MRWRCELKEIINVMIDIDASDISGTEWLQAITNEFDRAMFNLGYSRILSSKDEAVSFTYKRFAICGVGLVAEEK